MFARRLLPALAISLAAIVPAWAKPAVWVVRDADSELVLFGSLHVLPPGVDWAPPVLTQALAKADDVWFEVPFDADSTRRTGELAAQAGVLPPGQALSDSLPPTMLARLARACEALGVPRFELERLRPWMAELRLSLAAFAKDGGAAADGVEQQIALQAPVRVVRRAFETPEQQIALFADAPPAEQVASLDDTLRELESDPKNFDRLVAAWSRGDLKALDAQALRPMRRGSPALYRRMIVARNTRWIETLRARLAGAGETVVVVGAGHLIGPDGLPARLRALGYTVEGP
jgi:uncharacterized protein YbaP (TraB family)